MEGTLGKTTLAEAAKLFSRPERIVWAVAEHEGKRSICPLGWKMNCSGSPPMMAVAMSPSHFTHELISLSGEFVLAWPGEDLAEATHYCGTRSGRTVDKPSAMGLTTLAASLVSAPLIAECVANLECRLTGRLESGDHAILIGEIVAVWVNTAPKRLLCSVGNEAGYEQILRKGPWRFGVVRS